MCEVLYRKEEMDVNAERDRQRLIDSMDSSVADGGWKITSGENLLYITDDESGYFGLLGGYEIHALECVLCDMP